MKAKDLGQPIRLRMRVLTAQSDYAFLSSDALITKRQAHWCRFADLLARPLWMRRSHITQAQSTASHCLLTSPTGKWLFTDAQ